MKSHATRGSGYLATAARSDRFRHAQAAACQAARVVALALLGGAVAMVCGCQTRTAWSQVRLPKRTAIVFLDWSDRMPTLVAPDERRSMVVPGLATKGSRFLRTWVVDRGRRLVGVNGDQLVGCDFATGDVRVISAVGSGNLRAATWALQAGPRGDTVYEDSRLRLFQGRLGDRSRLIANDVYDVFWEGNDSLLILQGDGTLRFWSVLEGTAGAVVPYRFRAGDGIGRFAARNGDVVLFDNDVIHVIRDGRSRVVKRPSRSLQLLSVCWVSASVIAYAEGDGMWTDVVAYDLAQGRSRLLFTCRGRVGRIRSATLTGEAWRSLARSTPPFLRWP